MSGEHEVDEKNRQREDVDHGVARQNVLVSEFGPLELHAVRQLLIQDLGHGSFGLARTVTRCSRAIYFRRGKSVVVHDAVWSVDRPNVYDRAERDHFSCAVSGSEMADVFRLQAVRRFGLHIYLVRSTEAVEIVHVKRAEVHLHGVEDVVQRNSVSLGFLAIHVGIDLRNVHVEAGEQSS